MISPEGYRHDWTIWHISTNEVRTPVLACIRNWKKNMRLLWASNRFSLTGVAKALLDFAQSFRIHSTAANCRSRNYWDSPHPLPAEQWKENTSMSPFVREGSLRRLEKHTSGAVARFSSGLAWLSHCEEREWRFGTCNWEIPIRSLGRIDPDWYLLLIENRSKQWALRAGSVSRHGLTSEGAFIEPIARQSRFTIQCVGRPEAHFLPTLYQTTVVIKHIEIRPANTDPFVLDIWE